MTAANAFVATLDPAQQKSVQFAFTDSAQRVKWSNFPDGAAERAGARWGTLSASQRTALIDLLGAVLTTDGVRMVQEQMDADDIVKKNDTGPHGPPPDGHPPGDHPPDGHGPPPGGRMKVNFGSDYYYVAFLGTPSTTSPWMLQFGGHHLAINATIVGDKITVSPTLTGGEPLKFDKDGKKIYIVEAEVKRAQALLESLTAEQRKKAIVSDQRIDLVLGPGHDGQVLPAEGIVATELTDAQRAMLFDTIQARLEILNPDAMADVRANLGKTYFAWYGPPTLGLAYFRITGPTLQIEYSPQANDGDATDHAHNMYRDPTNEYGAAWTVLK